MTEQLSTPPRTVDAEIARTWLLVNATRTDTFDTAHQSCADQIVLDIEDAVDPTAKPTARADVARWLEERSAWSGSTTTRPRSGPTTSTL